MIAQAHIQPNGSILHEMAEALEEARVQVSILQDRLGIKDSGAGTLSIIDAALRAYREADHV